MLEKEDRKLSDKLFTVGDKFQVRVDLKLKNLPTSVPEIEPRLLMHNSHLREYGNLVNVKLARVVHINEPCQFMYRRTKLQTCKCVNQPSVVYEQKLNALKIFKNQVNFSTKMG